MAHQPIRGPGSGLKFLNHPFGVTTYTKVFVGGLAWEKKSKTLHSYFEHFGEILEAVVITDKHTGRSKGYGLVTFRDPEATDKACADPHPVIDGRKANCSFASHGRPQLPMPYGRVTSAVPYLGGPQTPRGPYAGSPSYFQPVSYSYRSGFPYSPYGSYLGQHQPQMFGVPGAVNTNAFSGQSGLPGNLGYRPIQGFVMPGPRLVQYSRPNFRGAPLEIIPTIQAPYITGMALSLGQATPAQFPQGGSD